MMNNKNQLFKLNHLNLTIRVSIDHFTKHKHEQIRGPNSWEPMIEGLKWLSENKFNTFEIVGTEKDSSDSNFYVDYSNSDFFKEIDINLYYPVIFDDDKFFLIRKEYRKSKER